MTDSPDGEARTPLGLVPAVPTRHPMAEATSWPNTVDAQGVGAWYAGFQYDAGWRLGQVNGGSRPVGPAGGSLSRAGRTIGGRHEFL
jgi:hypothetical protein